LQITKEGKIEEDRSKMFDGKKILYGIDTMDNAGYGFWQMAYYSDGSVPVVY
jgi:phage major head subunit gpT-like protein